MCLAIFCGMINAHLKERKKGRERESWMAKNEGGTRPINSGDDELDKGNCVPFVCTHSRKQLGDTIHLRHSPSTLEQS